MGPACLKLKVTNAFAIRVGLQMVKIPLAPLTSTNVNPFSYLARLTLLCNVLTSLARFIAAIAHRVIPEMDIIATISMNVLSLTADVALIQWFNV